jgi:hypothetical protein
MAGASSVRNMPLNRFRCHGVGPGQAQDVAARVVARPPMYTHGQASNV